MKGPNRTIANMSFNECSSLTLLDRFSFIVFGLTKEKGLVNSLYQFCSTNLHFLEVDNWLLMTSNRQQRTVNLCKLFRSKEIILQWLLRTKTIAYFTMLGCCLNLTKVAG